MPMHNGWLPREGLTADPIARCIKKTFLNPAVTIFFLLAANFTEAGSSLSAAHSTVYSWIKTLFYLGLVRWASGYLSNGALNNWTDDPYDWKKEIVLITGGAGGIGGNIVKLLAETGTKIVVLDVIPMTFDPPPNVFYYKCDITCPPLLATTATAIHRDHGAPTILINNAGVARGKSILDATEKDIRFTFSVNTLSHYFLARTFLPALVAANHGMVVTVSSYAAYITVPNMTDYAASKVAALAFHEGLTAELKTRYNAPKVRTAVVILGHTRTSLFKGYANDSTFLVPTLEPETVAEAVVRQVLSGKSGQVVVPGFGNVMALLRGLPHWVQLGVRSDGERAMKQWEGRQVIDLEGWKSGGGGGKE
ncbi:MAG: hypothetical protein Q9195_005012 [Heterodermia aff. obscurata]